MVNQSKKKVQDNRKYWSTHTQSIGERRIEEFLNKNNIFHLTEVRFNDCINPMTGQILMFDFFLPKYNQIIEYDGSQHEEYTRKFHGNKKLGKFEKQQVKDKIKDLYCVQKGYKLLRIKYLDWENIEKILASNLKIK